MSSTSFSINCEKIQHVKRNVTCNQGKRWMYLGFQEGFKKQFDRKYICFSFPEGCGLFGFLILQGYLYYPHHLPSLWDTQSQSNFCQQIDQPLIQPEKPLLPLCLHPPPWAQTLWWSSSRPPVPAAPSSVPWAVNHPQGEEWYGKSESPTMTEKCRWDTCPQHPPK